MGGANVFMKKSVDSKVPKSQQLQPETGPGAQAGSAPASALELPRQLELDFRAPVLQMFLPDQMTQAFWRATSDHPQEFASRIAKLSRRMQQSQLKADKCRFQARAAKGPD